MSAGPLAVPLIDPKYFASDATGDDIARRVEPEAPGPDLPLAPLLGAEMRPGLDCRRDGELEHHIRGHCTTL